MQCVRAAVGEHRVCGNGQGAWPASGGVSWAVFGGGRIWDLRTAEHSLHAPCLSTMAGQVASWMDLIIEDLFAWCFLFNLAISHENLWNTNLLVFGFWNPCITWFNAVLITQDYYLVHYRVGLWRNHACWAFWPRGCFWVPEWSLITLKFSHLLFLVFLPFSHLIVIICL